MFPLKIFHFTFTVYSDILNFMFRGKSMSFSESDKFIFNLCYFLAD